MTHETMPLQDNAEAKQEAGHTLAQEIMEVMCVNGLGKPVEVGPNPFTFVRNRTTGELEKVYFSTRI